MMLDHERVLKLTELLATAVNNLPAPVKNTTDRETTAGLGSSTRVSLARPVHVPSTDDTSFKTELVVFDDPDRGTIKLNFWGGDDLREDLHNHPWRGTYRGRPDVSFVSYILRGGYTEDVERLLPTGETEHQGVRIWREGDQNVVLYNDFHTVYDVLPDTVTLMVCCPRVNFRPDSAWGYLIDGAYVDATSPKFYSPKFYEKFVRLNPFRRK